VRITHQHRLKSFGEII